MMNGSAEIASHVEQPHFFELMKILILLNLWAGTLLIYQSVSDVLEEDWIFISVYG